MFNSFLEKTGSIEFLGKVYSCPAKPESYPRFFMETGEDQKNPVVFSQSTVMINNTSGFDNCENLLEKLDFQDGE